MNVDFLEPTDPRWAAALEGLAHDVYHLPAFSQAFAATEGARPVLVVARDGSQIALVPLLFKPSVMADHFEATTPYGYPAPLVCGDETFAAGAARSMVDALRQQRVISMFARMHPLLDSGRALTRHVGTYIEHGETIWIDLSRTEEELWTDTRSNHRNQINRSIKAGNQAFFDAEWDHFNDFVRLYENTMRRVSASSYYMFPHSHYDELRRGLGDHVHLVCVRIGESIAAAALFFETDGLVQYHLGATDDGFLRVQPMKHLMHHVRLVMREKGNTRMHLGGGVGASEDSLFHFKVGFSPLRATFGTWRVVVDREAFTALSSRAGVAADPAGFFPPWRYTPDK
jgi:CelD/BcsL family acetyltransferase involved in cellulose biosynthesis